VSDSEHNDDPDAPTDVVKAVADFMDDLVDERAEGLADDPEPTAAD